MLGRLPRRLDELQQVVGVLLSQLQEMAASVQQWAESMVAQPGEELVQELDRTQAAAGDSPCGPFGPDPVAFTPAVNGVYQLVLEAKEIAAAPW